MGSKNPFRNRSQPPPFRRGDFVTPCVGKRSYGKWRHGEFREIHDVIYDDTNDPYGSWVLVIWNPLKSTMSTFLHQCSKYNPANFTKESYIMPSPPHMHQNCCEERPRLESAFYAVFSFDKEDQRSLTQLTDGVPKESDAEDLLQKQIMTPGEVFIIMKSVKRIEVLPPTPPIRVTHLR